MIRQAVERKEYKTFIHRYVYVEDKTILELMRLGYKVHRGDWDKILTDVTIIDW